MARSEKLYRLTIGSPLIIPESYFVPFKNETFQPIDLESFYNKEDPNGYIFTRHQIQFTIKTGSSTTTTNTASITLFNLEDDVVEYLEANSNNNIVCVLEAGDNEQGLSDLFRGTVQAVQDDFTTVDRKTKLLLTDGGVNARNAYTVRSYPRNTPYDTILRDLTFDLKFPISTQTVVAGQLKTPTSYNGNTFEILTKLLPNLGYNFSVQQGLAKVTPKDSRVRREASFISKETGLLGKVNAEVNDTKSTSTTAGQNSKGINFVCLLDAAIQPEETVYVQDGKYDGAFKVLSVVFEGDYEGNSWFCQVKAVEVEGVIDG